MLCAIQRGELSANRLLDFPGARTHSGRTTVFEQDELYTELNLEKSKNTDAATSRTQTKATENTKPSPRPDRLTASNPVEKNFELGLVEWRFHRRNNIRRIFTGVACRLHLG